MARHAPRDDGPSPEDIERFGGVTQPCPECGAELYDDVTLCWKCGHVIGNQGRRPRNLLPALIAVLLIIVFLFWAIRPHWSFR